MNQDGTIGPIAIAATQEPGIYTVDVQGRAPTRHRVTVSPEYLRELGLGSQPADRVLREAFAFLLNRESNTSILRTFDLREIERYFPEFRREIAGRFNR